ncbi:putative methanol dehydrogenase-like protein, cytochrome cL (XoxG) [Verminephrobacter eiseniae EF01-2]|uniref:Putative methanol dehydrogenase-like protein, cytochrome cL (XoxG) n=2 Tax=Verminephrobacter eiseniae TaxID=364317 RepID=A1WSQ3_VEREI|nr:putative methanol dehydrogenase-like protein, cytochrome cL (XoxG) [Verminephrobacter eiseniae EF01-2]
MPPCICFTNKDLIDMLRSSCVIILALLACSLCAAQGKGESAQPLYQVTEGNKVDAKTLEGWKTWRALACERCHGAQQEGLVGPSLLESLKKLSPDAFHDLVMQGKIDKGMPNFAASDAMQKNWQNLYAYLKGRSDGKIMPGRVYPADK